MEPVNLMEVSEKKLKEYLDSFDHVFSDCDGVIWSLDPLPHVGKFFEIMKQLGKTVHFVSNNSMRPRHNYEALFKAAHINNGYSNLTVPSTAIVTYLESVKFNKTVYCVACPETVNVLETHGFKCRQGPETCADFYSDYIEYLTDDEEIGAVVFDSDFKVNLPKLYKALTYLKRPEVLFVNGATDKYLALKPGSKDLSLGTSVFSDIVIEEAKRKPIMLGKPAKSFGEFAMKRAGVTDPSRVLFIGDMIEQDVALGKVTGFKTLLVLTSRTKEEMLSHELKPDFYADSLGSLVPILQKHLPDLI